jgi:hypothetical protein
MAADLINKNNSLLADYSLQVLVQDTKCAPDQVMKAFIKYVTNKTHPIAGILGKPILSLSPLHVLFLCTVSDLGSIMLTLVLLCIEKGNP